MTRFRITITTRGAVLLVVLGMGFIFLWTIRPILPPLVWALIIAYILDPVVGFLSQKLHVRRFLVVVLLFIVLVGSAIWIFLAMRPVLTKEVGELTVAIPRIVDDVQEFLLGSAPIQLLGLTIDPQGIKAELDKGIRDGMSTWGRQAIPFVARAVGSVVHLFLFLIAAFYMLLDLNKVGPAIVNFLPRRWRRDIIPLFLDMERVLGSYIRGQVLLIIIMTVASWIVLTILQVRYAFILAIVTGVVEIFPVIGPWTAGTIAVSVALTQPTTLFDGNSAMLAIAVGVSYFVLRQLEDIFVIPNVVGKIMEMHPLVVLFSLTAGGYLAGILGVLIAVPIAAVVKLYLRFLHQKLVEEDRAPVNGEHAVTQADMEEEDDP